MDSIGTARLFSNFSRGKKKFRFVAYREEDRMFGVREKRFDGCSLIPVTSGNELSNGGRD